MKSMPLLCIYCLEEIEDDPVQHWDKECQDIPKDIKDEMSIGNTDSRSLH